MGEVRKLDRCYRCRKVFLSDGKDHYCPDCRREMRREKNRRRLRVQGARRSAWIPVLLLAVLTIVGGAFNPSGAWIGAAAALAVIWKQGWGG